ncbi:Serine-threonine kinase receptor-associated protein [Cytospora mali]|uniref:Serine-threonine kinase receptor-associated protein n=1 Tax=Cytospora mali TaxID=578113 RepID=A0A194W0E3_CYTMA|nr:Serine-threonine kinase receptor-associated protein [Valsa mali]
MASNGEPRQYLPLTCHGHSRPVPHISFSSLEKDGDYFIISACKDGNPMLRHGRTGDWIGTFIGHKGATWQAKLSPDNKTAASASADFSTKVWNAHTGEMLLVLKHDHVVRAVAFPLNISDILATGGHEKILRIWDLKSEDHKDDRVTTTTDENGRKTLHIPHEMAHQIGEVHPDTIKFIVWPRQITIITAAGKTLRWHDVSTRQHYKEEVFDSEIKSCELVSLAPQYTSPTDIGGGQPVLCIAAGKKVCFYGGADCTQKIKEFNLPHGVASVGLDLKNKKFVVGEEPGTWARVYDWDGQGTQEIDIMKGHHGPIWCVQFSPDGKLYATGSEDGTIRMWKNCDEDYGLWRDRGVATAEKVE